MQTQRTFIKFGEDVQGYSVPVLNEREVRASAGLMFLALFISLTQILFKHDFVMVKYVIVVFFADFAVRIFINPRFSPVLILGRLIVSRQVPEYVGAPQKRFAWNIGLILSSFMFVLLVVLNTYSVLNGVTCLVCLVFLFFESAFGICLGCLVYGWFYNEETVHCAGDLCTKTERQPVQKTTGLQLVIVFGCIVYVLLTMLFFNQKFQVAPKKLNELFTSSTRSTGK